MSKLERIVPQALAISVQEAIFENDGEKLKRLLEKLLRESASFYDTEKETFYHGLVLGLCAMLGGSYSVTSNRESGDGRYDLQLMPENISCPGFIIELKAEKDQSSDQLKELAQIALQQIVDRKYETEMQCRGIKNIVKYGVAFSGKSVKLPVLKDESI